MLFFSAASMLAPIPFSIYLYISQELLQASSVTLDSQPAEDSFFAMPGAFPTVAISTCGTYKNCHVQRLAYILR